MIRLRKTLHSPGSPDRDDERPLTRLPSLMVLPGTSRVDPWQSLGYADLANTVRRICTLCGWSQIAPDVGQALAITSAVQGEGKSSLARAVAITMAQDHEAEVLLIECDLLSPTLCADFGIEPGLGLSEILAGEAGMVDALHQSALPNLWLLPGGSRSENPSRLLRSPLMTAMLDEARLRFAFIVLDLPALHRSSDAAVIARLADRAVLVVRAGSTDEQAVQRAVQYLPGVPLQGVVLNRWRSSIPRLVRQLIER